MLDRVVHIVQIITAVLVAAFVILLFVNEPAQPRRSRGRDCERGGVALLDRCASCHGADGGGSFDPRSAAAWPSAASRTPRTRSRWSARAGIDAELRRQPHARADRRCRRVHPHGSGLIGRKRRRYRPFGGRSASKGGCRTPRPRPHPPPPPDGGATRRPATPSRSSRSASSSTSSSSRSSRASGEPSTTCRRSTRRSSCSVSPSNSALGSYSMLTRTALPRHRVSVGRMFRIQLSTRALASVVPGGSAAGSAPRLPPAHLVRR